MTQATPDIRALCLDVDGVLTDGRLHVDDDGHVRRSFHIHDGLAIRAFQRLGGVVMICTAKRSGAVTARARELGIAHVIQGSENKHADVAALLDALGLDWPQLAAMGDDLPDLPVLQACAYPIAVANAAPELKAAARYLTEQAGGNGAVREAIEHLLGPDRWAQVVAHYAGPNA